MPKKTESHARDFIVSYTKDFVVSNYGSIILLEPLTEAGKVWVEEHIGRENGFQPMWPTVVVEPRYLADIIDGITNDGLTISA